MDCSKDDMMVDLIATGTDLHGTCRGRLLDVRKAMQRVERFMLAQDVAPETWDDLNLVMSEAMTNIARHAYPDQEGSIGFHLHLDQTAVRCCLVDSGIAFDPSSTGRAAPEPSAFPEGGYGWFLVRSLTDTLSYNRKDGVNTLRFSILHGVTRP